MCTKTLWRFGSQQVADGGVGNGCGEVGRAKRGEVRPGEALGWVVTGPDAATTSS